MFIRKPSSRRAVAALAICFALLGSLFFLPTQTSFACASSNVRGAEIINRAVLPSATQPLSFESALQSLQATFTRLFTPEGALDDSFTTVTSSLNPSHVGNSVTFTATVEPYCVGTPTGTVIFTIDLTPTSPITLDGGSQATYTTSALSVGVHSVTVTYSGDDDFNGSTSDTLTQQVVSEEVPVVVDTLSKLCDQTNFDEDSVVRASVTDGEGYAVNCRLLYKDGSPVQLLNGDPTTSGSIGVEGILRLGVIQAIDIFSPPGMNYFTGGAVFCLKGEGTLIWLAASGIPRHAEIIGSYTVPEFPGYTCATLFEPGTLVLVHDDPTQQ